MRVTLFLIALLSFKALNAQIDSSVVLNPDTSVALKFSRHPYPGTTDVCRNDTVWLYDWQYDSLQNYYRNKYHGMSIWGTGPTADTLIHFGKEDWYTSDFHGWVRDWIINYDACTYYFIYYDSGELHISFRDQGEGHFGEFNEYHKNGQLKCRGSYCTNEVGMRYGVWNWYDEQGKIIRTKNYKGDKHCTGEKTGYRRFTLYRRKCDY